MEAQTRQQLQALMPALKSLQSSVERAYHTTMYQGVGKMSVRTYNVLHSKIVSLLPDDVYVTDALKLDVTEADEEKVQVAQISLAASQLYNYLKNVLADEEPWIRQDEVRELKNLGRDLQERILNQTRTALRRALAGLDDVPPVPPTPPTPGVPPVPPTPPVPNFGGRIHIEIGDEDDKPKNRPPDIV
jgi:cobalamin biosynthesis Mg chelatase CobN